VAPVVIVALGDSTTAGTPLFESPLEAPPDGRGDERSQYAYWLMARHPDWRVLNRGVNGERSDQIAARFDRDVVNAQPAAVVIIAGVNDIYQGKPAAAVTAQLRAIFDRAATEKIPVVAGSILPYNTATGPQNAAMHSVNSWIAAEAARDPRIRFVDTRAAVAAAGDLDRLSASPDGLHPDVDAYHRMADAIEPVLRDLLARGDVSPLHP